MSLNNLSTRDNFCLTADLLCYSNPESIHRLVLLHGWGADAEDLISIGQELSRDLPIPPIEIVSLRAPQMHPEGIGRQWYGLFPANWLEVPLAINSLKNRLEALGNSKIPLEKTVLLGSLRAVQWQLQPGASFL